MSASREKKQRQGVGPSEKHAQAQQEQAARKRKTITYSVIGVVVAVLVAALLIWNSGFFQARATAATVGGTKLTAAELSFYYYDVRNEYATYSSIFGQSFDSTLPDDEQFYNEVDNITWKDYFMDIALGTAQQYLSLCDEALAAGYTAADVKDSLKSSIDSMKSTAASYGYSYAAYLRAMYGPYMTAGVYEKLVEQIQLASLIYNDKGNDLFDSYTEADLQEFYAENADGLDTFEYSYLYFTPDDVETTDADGNELDEDTVNTLKEQALAAAKSTADEALAEYEDGESVAHLIEHYSPGSSVDHSVSVGSSTINSVIRDELLTMKAGEAAIVENSTSGYYVVMFHDRYLEDAPTKNVRHILVLAETTADESGTVAAPTEEAWAAAREKAESIMAEYEAGAKTEDAFAALANQYSDDGDGTTGGLYQRIDIGDAYVPEFLEWIFEDGRQAGDVGLVQHSAADTDSNQYWGYHIMYLVGDDQPLWMRTSRNSLVETDRDAWMLELAENYETALADGAKPIGS